MHYQNAALAVATVVNGKLVLPKEFEITLGILKDRAAALGSVENQDKYQEALALARDCKQEIKAIEALAEPERIALQNRTNALRESVKTVLAPLNAILAPVDQAARQYKIHETEEAQKEQARLNKGKKADHRVQVKPALEGVAGARGPIIRYEVDLVDAELVKRAYLAPDMKRIGELARKDQNPAKTEKTVGGIRVRKV